MQLVLKTAKKPEVLSAANEIETYYQNEMKTYFWHYVYRKDDRFYFFISRPAPSLYGKRTGIGGSFVSENNLNVKSYIESFHTYKLPYTDLEKKGQLLFEKLVSGADLSGYQPGGKFARNSEWIEFPNASHYFDAKSQSWKTRIAAPVNP